MLAAKQRNELPPPCELNPAISDRVNWAIMRAMSGDPAQRPGSCKEFVEDLTGASLRPQAPAAAATDKPTADLWYLVYRDEDGETHTVKGTTDGIRKALKDGLLGDASNIRASRSKQGQFLHLTGYPEFRDLVIRAAPVPGKDSTPIGQAMRQTPGAARQTPVTPTPVRHDPEAVQYAAASSGASPPSGKYDPTQDYRPAGESTTRPLIPVGRGHEKKKQPAAKRIDYILWGGVLAVALITSLAAMFLLPKLMR